MNDFPYPLQPLRVPGGWTISVNTLFEVDPGPRTMQWFSSALLLWGHSRDSGYCFNSHFEPEDDPEGEFVLENGGNTSWPVPPVRNDYWRWPGSAWPFWCSTRPVMAPWTSRWNTSCASTTL